MRTIIAFCALATGLACAAPAQAATLTALGAGVLTTNLGGGLVDFETPASVTTAGNTAPPQGTFTVGGATFSGDGILMTGTTPGLYATPYHDTTQYLTVKPNGPSETVTFGGPFQALGLYWGSMDTYNSIEFYSGGSLVDTVTGSQAATATANVAAVGNQTDDLNNRYIIISGILGGTFDKIVLLSTQNSFELDNLSWGPTNAHIDITPLPGALPMFAAGMAGFGFFLRRKRAAKPSV